MKPTFVALAAAVLTSTVLTAPCHAQRFFQDYFRSAGSSYQPSDPWVKGSIFRTHTGHDGRYYNCDKEECKRYSPHIYWKKQGCRENIHTLRFVRKETKQTVNDAICRWKRGSCQTCPPAGNYPPGAGYGVLASAKEESILDNQPTGNEKNSNGQSPVDPQKNDTNPKNVDPNNKAPKIDVVPSNQNPPGTDKGAQPKVVPPLKPLIDRNSSGLFPQNHIRDRKPNSQIQPNRIIGQWTPSTSQSQVQRTAARPVKTRGYGTLHQSTTSSSAETVIR